MKKKYTTGCLFVILCTCFLVGQTKNEKEERISLEKLPLDAVTIIKTLPKASKRIKFYSETDGEHKSYEAKFKYKKYWYSLEFTPIGSIEDIEKTVKFKSIKSGYKEKILNYYDTKFKNYSILKTQKQYVPKSNEDAVQFVEDVLNSKKENQANFEIIAEVKTNSERVIKEFTFNANGNLIFVRTVEPSSYEYVLY